MAAASKTCADCGKPISKHAQRCKSCATSVYEPTLTEAQWQSQVVSLARQCGWTQYHTFDSRRSAAGFPDIVLVKPPRILFWELKTDRGKTTPDQEKWLALLRACGLQAEVIRPSDREKVHRVLMGIE